MKQILINKLTEYDDIIFNNLNIQMGRMSLKLLNHTLLKIIDFKIFLHQ